MTMASEKIEDKGMLGGLSAFGSLRSRSYFVACWVSPAMINVEEGRQRRRSAEGGCLKMESTRNMPMVPLEKTHSTVVSRVL